MIKFFPAVGLCLSALVTFNAHAQAGNIKAAVSYSQGDSSFTPLNGNSNSTETDTFGVSVSYDLSKSLSLAANFSQTDSNTVGINNTLRTDSTTDLFGLTATYKLSNNVSVFGGYSYGQVDVDTVVIPGVLFYSNDIDLDVYVAGASYFNVLNKNMFYGVTGVVSYASTDIDDYLLQTGQIGRPGEIASVTTLTLSPTIGYKAGNMVYTASYSHNIKNRAGGAEPDRVSGKAKIGAKYSINKAASLAVSYSEVVSKEATDSDSIDIKFGYAF